MSPSGIMAELRSGTSTEHQALEDALELTRYTRTLPGYVHILQTFQAFVVHWEAAARAACPEHLKPLFEERQRASLLLDDLHFFHAQPIVASPRLPEVDSRESFLGSMYVMEGSTLGGQLIARHLESELGLRDGHGYQYFRGYGAETRSMWREFSKVIAHEAESLDNRAIVYAAQQLFEAFRDWILLRKASMPPA